MISFFKKHINIISYVLFFLYAVVNFIFIFYHEPWRDEIHAWTMAKYLSVKDLFIVSRFDGHPVLWHLILMPFAKLNFPIITLNIISWLIVTISAYAFVFHTKLNPVFKFITLFTIPFMYIFSVISRNYCLILLFLVLIGICYKDRYNKPILYSILICFLIHTHALSWGIVAGLTITFHFYEIIKYFFLKNNAVSNIKQIIIGLFFIVLNTIFVVLQLYGTTNSDYTNVVYTSTISHILFILFSFILFLLITFLFSKKNLKELFIIFCGFSFQYIIYLYVYGALVEARLILPYVLWLFFIILVSSTDIKKNALNIFLATYIMLILSRGDLFNIYNSINKDINYSFSSSIEMADYINNNLKDESTILIDSSIICQSIVPHLKNAHLYDIIYNDYFENIKYMTSISEDNIQQTLKENSDRFSNKYLIISSDSVQLDYEVVYKTKSSIKGENYTLYYIK